MKSHSKRRRGFTLVELIVVIAIIGLMASAVGVAVFKWIGKGEKARIKTDFKTLESSVQLYYTDTRRLPQDLKDLVRQPGGVQNWDGPYIKDGKMPLDPWNNPYKLKVPGQDGAKFEIVCYGSDGRPGGEGDAQDYSSSTMGRPEQAR